MNVSVPGNRHVGSQACRHVSAGTRALTRTQCYSQLLHTDQCKCRIGAVSEQRFAKNTPSHPRLRASPPSLILPRLSLCPVSHPLVSSFAALTACHCLHPVGPPSIQLHPQDKCLSQSPPAPKGSLLPAQVVFPEFQEKAPSAAPRASCLGVVL